MKKLFLIGFILFISSIVNGQDTIVKKSGDQILAKVSEITPTEVKYKRFDFQDGPLYVELKSNIDMIKFSNGIKEVFKQEIPVKTTITVTEKTNDYYSNAPIIQNNRIETWGSRFRYHDRTISERELHEMLLKTNNKQIMGFVGQAKDAKSMQYIGFAAIPLGITSYVFLLKSSGLFSTRGGYNKFDSGDLAVSAICAAAAITCPIISGVSKSNRNKSNRQAIKIYNEKF
jgi:hypothetical protein